MIFDKIINCGSYRGLNEGLDRAFDFLLTEDLNKLETGKHTIDGENIYAACMEYETKEKSLSKNEAHKKYIDVQYVVSGKEMMTVCSTDGLSVTEEYSDEKDVLFFENKSDCDLMADEGYFAVFFPEDAHAPGIAAGGKAAHVKKVVVKVHV